ncbi:hypothetical protein E3Q24_01207 [Wallemia mellicola]|uniref:AB hydrolase-1 domain-containing protein n=1 Tax=Wallemia mellicola TaxID=1708541 RepID=A0AB74KET3_9BASI|nr:hypothetical protein E3Q24_01207 [Wallemia mellicola]TIC23673.1 hypothetical protein E3Q12_01886 [Wallemia mellicola]TIC35901.1 hypothetical protein E3Q09_01811 [Wallemia mellicola]TIC67310.1 hypothetical protein E3Q03_01940 [Wallemia mellicola]
MKYWLQLLSIISLLLVVLYKAHDGIDWYNCADSDKYNAQCSYIDTPMVHEDTSQGTFKLFVKRVWQKNLTVDGLPHLFWNPGGPGIPSGSDPDSGVEAFSDMLYTFTGKDYALVGIDARGTGLSDLKVDCGNDHSSILPDTPPQISGAEEVLFRQQLGEYFASETSYFANCTASSPYLSRLGTYFVADDYKHIQDMLVGRQSLINLFGESYGSFLGQVLAAKYPNRVGKFVLSGIMSPKTRSLKPALESIPDYLTSTDKVFDKFVSSCQQSSSCNFKDITKELVDKLTDSVYNTTNEAILQLYPTRSKVINTIYLTMYAPSNWNLAFGEISKTAAIMNTMGAVTNEQMNNAVTAINCADAFITDFSIDDAINAMKGVYNNVSRRFYNQFLYQSAFTCHLYPRATFTEERITNFSGLALSNKILLLSSAFDPILPLAQAQETLKILGDDNAMLLQIDNGYGHTATPNGVIPDTDGCIQDRLRAYFNGENNQDVYKCRVNDQYYIEIYN